MDINDIIDSIYKLPDASKEALLSDAPEVAYPKGFHLFRANHKSSKFYLMKKYNRPSRLLNFTTVVIVNVCPPGSFSPHHNEA